MPFFMHANIIVGFQRYFLLTNILFCFIFICSNKRDRQISQYKFAAPCSVDSNRSRIFNYYISQVRFNLIFNADVDYIRTNFIDKAIKKFIIILIHDCLQKIRCVVLKVSSSNCKACSISFKLTDFLRYTRLCETSFTSATQILESLVSLFSPILSSL